MSGHRRPDRPTPAILSEHQRYLGDRNRLMAFREAIEALVAPASVVLDLGSGTGILGVMAARAGAQEVVAVEETGLIAVARLLADANGVASRIRFVRAYSCAVDIEVRADVVVGDLLGPAGVEANQVEAYHDAQARLMKEGGRCIPHTVATWFAPATVPDLDRRIDFWGGVVDDISLAPVLPYARNSVHAVERNAVTLLAQSSLGWLVTLGHDAATPRTATLQWTVRDSAILSGVVAYFVAELAPGILITNGYAEVRVIDRPVAVLPCPPTKVVAGDRINATIDYFPESRVFAWTIEINDSSGSVARHRAHTLRGRLITAEDLQP